MAPNTYKRRAIRNPYKYRPKRGHKAEEKRIKKTVNEMSYLRKVKQSKYLDGVWNITTSTAGTVYGSLNTIGQGDGSTNRNGDKVQVTRLEVSGEINLPTTSTVADMNDYVRLIVYVDKQCNGANATRAAILDKASPYSFYNPDNQPMNNPKRFRILFDKTFNLNASAAGYNGTSIVSGTVRKPFKLTKDMKVNLQYNGATGVVSELNNSNLGMLAISSQGAATINCDIKTHFVDGDSGL